MILSDRSKITKFFITTILLLCVHAAQAFITAERKERGCSSSLSHITSRICRDHKHLPSRWNSINPLASAKTAAESNKGEVLMKISFSLKEGHDDKTKAIDILRSYVASFPFSAVLPVQPLTYLPREDGKGVDVSFLRKKTQEKGSIDGGIEFLISSGQAVNGNDTLETIDLVAIRNDEGQSISKVFSEGLIVKSLTSGLYGEGGYVGKGKDELFAILTMDKVVHKWM